MKKIPSIFASLVVSAITAMTINQSAANAFPRSIANKDLGWWTNTAKVTLGEKSIYQWVITDHSFGAKAAVELFNRGLVLGDTGFIVLGDGNGGSPIQTSSTISTIGLACNYNPMKSAALLEKLAHTSANLGTLLVKLCNTQFSDAIVKVHGYMIIPHESTIHPGTTGGFLIK